MVERCSAYFLTLKAEVAGSNPVGATKYPGQSFVLLAFFLDARVAVDVFACCEKSIHGSSFPIAEAANRVQGHVLHPAFLAESREAETSAVHPCMRFVERS